MSQIILIDDDNNFRDLIKVKLNSFLQNIKYIEFGDLTSFKNTFTENLLENTILVVIDQHLPDGEGTDLLRTNVFLDLPVLSVSSDISPEIPSNAIISGANIFISKTAINEKLFEPLVKSLLSKHQLIIENQKLREDKIKNSTIKTLIGTLRHEINNPLGAVMGATFLVQQGINDPKTKEAINLIELSSKRIKYVIEKLGEQMDLNSISKSDLEVFEVPGDKPWEK